MDAKPSRSELMDLVIARKASRGGFTSQDVGYWAAEFEVSDETLQRYVLARRAFTSWWRSTRKLVKEMPTPPGEKWTDKFGSHLHEAPENEITREYKEAKAALDAAPEVPPSRDPSTGRYTERKLRVMARHSGVSEEVMLRFERAQHAYLSLKYSKALPEAEPEASLRATEREKLDLDEYVESFKAAFDRTRDTMPENEITREYDEAYAALEAAVLPAHLRK